MNRSNNPAGTTPERTRREALGLLGAGAALLGAGSALAQGDGVLTEALVLRDPDVPSTGNSEGDVNIVEWFDYNCPYCRKIAPEIQQVVQDDGKVRLVLKEWPILGEVSKFGARMAMAAKYQDKYLAAHEAMKVLVRGVTSARFPLQRAHEREHRVLAALPGHATAKSNKVLFPGGFSRLW